MDKLYVIVRSDLKPGLQTAQALHAGMSWCKIYDEVPTNVVVLSVPALEDLSVLGDQLRDKACRSFCFHEPDLNDQATAIAVGGEASKFLANLPLALRDDPKFDTIYVQREA